MSRELWQGPESIYRVAFDGSFRTADATTEPPAGCPDKQTLKQRLDELNREIDRLQRVLFADNRYAVLLVFQALDAGGKDSTIRAVLNRVDPAGCRVYSYKSPNAHELEHDFLWRTAVDLPRRGMLGVFNRSYYEEVLIVRVHPEYLAAQRLPDSPPIAELWEERLESIRDHEHHLARNGTIVLKFWLNISHDEQRRRFLDRLKRPDKHWKFEQADMDERVHWDDYQHAYEAALNSTSRPWAPWYAIPADNKPYMRVTVAETLVNALRSLPLAYPAPAPNLLDSLDNYRKLLKKS